MNKLLLAVIGLAFAIGLPSKEDANKPHAQNKHQLLAKETPVHKERLYRRW